MLWNAICWHNNKVKSFNVIFKSQTLILLVLSLLKYAPIYLINLSLLLAFYDPTYAIL